jgi:hypothetical protein
VQHSLSRRSTGRAKQTAPQEIFLRPMVTLVTAIPARAGKATGLDQPSIPKGHDMPQRVRPTGTGGYTFVIIPFKEKYSDEHVRSTKGLMNGEETAKFGLVKVWSYKYSMMTCLDTVRADGTSQFQTILDRINGRIAKSADFVIYIRGHCSAGGTTLVADRDESERITAAKLTKLFDGLDRSFSGHFKIFGCHTAAGKPSSHSQSFTQDFANEMFQVGFKSCHFYGYTESVSTWRYRRGEKKAHKFTTGDDPVRASNVRVGVLPVEVKVSCQIM